MPTNLWKTYANVHHIYGEEKSTSNPLLGAKSERIGVEWLFIAAVVFVHLLSMSLLSLLFVGTMTYNYIIHVTNHRLLNCLTTTDPVHHQPTIPPE